MQEEIEDSLGRVLADDDSEATLLLPSTSSAKRRAEAAEAGDVSCSDSDDHGPARAVKCRSCSGLLLPQIRRNHGQKLKLGQSVCRLLAAAECVFAGSFGGGQETGSG